MISRLAIYKLIQEERARQDFLRTQGKFQATLADTSLYGVPMLSPVQKHAVLAEEVGEVARVCLGLERLVPEPADIDMLRSELVQVAALAVAWIESLGDPDDEPIPIASS